MSLAITLPLALAAGALTMLSPCVLPLAPIIVSSARSIGEGRSHWPPALLLTFGVGGGALASAGVEVDGSERGARHRRRMVVAGIVMLTPSLAFRPESALSGGDDRLLAFGSE